MEQVLSQNDQTTSQVSVGFGGSIPHLDWQASMVYHPCTPQQSGTRGEKGGVLIALVEQGYEPLVWEKL